jgi:UDP-glucuronate 4-epimerase
VGLNPKRILLTGGAGFIGSHLAEALIRRGARLSIVDNLDNFYALSRKRQNLQEIESVGTYEFFETDLRDADALRRVAARVQPEIVIHLAARAGVRPSIEQPLLYESVNVAGTVNLLEIAREFKVERFVFGSSSSVYGITNTVPFCQDSPNLALCRNETCWRDDVLHLRAFVWIDCPLSALLYRLRSAPKA